MSNFDGFYAAYMTGSEGNGFGLFLFKNGTIIGSDPLGVSFDGVYTIDLSGVLSGEIAVTVPPGETVIQGVSAGPNELRYLTPLCIDTNMIDSQFFRVDTPLGPVNVKLKKLRSLEVADG